MTRQHPSLFAHRALVTRSLSLAVLTLLAAFCLLPSAFGQSATATLSGTVEDQNGAAIPGVTITVVNKGTQLKREATTNEQGSFTIPLLPPGGYTVRAQGSGFAPAEFTSVVLNVGDQKALQVQLKAGDINAQVQVTNEPSLINESPAVGTTVDRQFVENIPLNGRSFQSLITLTPGIVLVPVTENSLGGGQFSVNGQRPSGNAFIVDGVSANFGAAPDGFPGLQSTGNLPGLTTFGTTQSLVSVDALQEFNVQTSTYSAEYGRQPGGQISIVTRSGTNDFHGSAFDYIRNDVFDANDWFANANGLAKAAMRQNDFGGTFGGPIFKDKTFFFFSYEGLRLLLPTFTRTNVPTLALRQQAPAGMQPIMNAFPLPTGRDLGNGLAEFPLTYSNHSTLNATSIRIDHAINSKLSVFGRYNQSPSESANRNGGNLSIVNHLILDTKTLTIGLTASLTSRTINNFRANYSDNAGWADTQQDTLGGATPIARGLLIPSQYDLGGAQGAVSLSLPGRTGGSLISAADKLISSQRQLNFVDDFSYSVGAHQFKFGIDYRRLSPVFRSSTYLGFLFFRSLGAILNSTATSDTISAVLAVRPLYTNFSAYAQDTWKLSRRLTLNLGLRWEVNPAPGEANGNLPLALTQITNLSTMQLAPRDTPAWKTTYNNFGPRIGLAYQLSQNPGREMVVRGGFGVFYDTGNDQGSAGYGGYPFVASRIVSNVTFPLNPVQVAPPPIPSLQSSLPSPYGTINAFDPALKLPYTLQWNVSAERSLGNNQAVTLSYVGAAGKRLLQQRGLLDVSTINPFFTGVFLTANTATSDYNALQAQFQRRLSRGLQTLASYTWSHAIDDDSTSSTGRVAQRGNAAFDVRHVFSAAVTYDIPSSKKFGAANVIFSRWAIDTTVHAQSAPPVDLIADTIIDPSTGNSINVRPNVTAGAPWYIDDPTVPGGRRINSAAFSNPPAGQSGNLGRNQLRGLPALQVDLALRREFKLREKLKLQLRAEAFNLFNHPNFGAIDTDLSSPNFGQATNMLNRSLGGINQLYQIGGPRSLQFAVKVLF